NRNKRSIAVDITAPEGVALIKRLAAVSDVVVENYKPGDLARRGLSYDDLKAVKPDLVWCSITGFGRTGPLSDRIGYDFLVQAMGGIMSITGDPDGDPMKVGVGISDLMCGMYAVVGILAALRHRDATRDGEGMGEGQFFEVSLYDTQIAWLANAATNYLVSGKTPQRLGNRHANIAPYQTYRASDGHLVVAVGNNGQFARFCTALGRPDMPGDPRFVDNSARLAHVDEMEREIADILLGESVAHWVLTLNAVNVPSGPVADVAQALENPHTHAREMVVEMENPAGGERLRLPGNPLKMEGTPVRYDRPPPRLDADREAILREVLGLGDEDVTRLREAGAFGGEA
ncbi:MAG TPA: CaiB/BaiF CoA-transferase family protein, partial [Saliniramus sp.]|nr:CaiB/BaiF CoA-transferase family protein [Saliniramus sp.]